MICAVLALLLLSSSPSHPVPAPRYPPIRPDHLSGTWLLHWEESRYYLHLRPDGSMISSLYDCPEVNLIGRWSVEGRTLHVWEGSPLSHPDRFLHWQVDLDSHLRGRALGCYGASVRLERVKSLP